MPDRAASARGIAWLLAAMSAIGPFAIDTYLPAFEMMAQSLGATQLEVQQTLSIYLLLFGVMNLWHGSISDALGRRVVLLGGLGLLTRRRMAAGRMPVLRWAACHLALYT